MTGGWVAWLRPQSRTAAHIRSRRQQPTATKNISAAQRNDIWSDIDAHTPDRPRKLLLHRDEIERLIGKTAEKGLTLVPVRIYFKGPRAKVELALASGKEGRDRRREIADRDVRREVERDFKSRMR